MCSKCGKKYKSTDNSYCKSCRKAYNKKNSDKIKKKFEGYYVYLFLDSRVRQVCYVGITENIYKRLHTHLTGNSNKKDFIKTKKWTSVSYMDCSWFLYDREELLFLENYLIEKYKPSENRKLNIIKNVSAERQNEIINDYCRLSKKGFWTKCTKDTFKVS